MHHNHDTSGMIKEIKLINFSWIYDKLYWEKIKYLYNYFYSVFLYCFFYPSWHNSVNVLPSFLFYFFLTFDIILISSVLNIFFLSIPAFCLRNLNLFNLFFYSLLQIRGELFEIIETEVVLIKIEINNDCFVNFLQNNPLDIQHIYSIGQRICKDFSFDIMWSCLVLISFMSLTL